MTAAKRFTVRTAYEGDVFHASPELRVTSEGTWAGDKLQKLSESGANDLMEFAREHGVTLVMESDSEPDSAPAGNKE